MVTHPMPDKSPDRIFFVDHLRVALVILVVLHHVAVIYGANTPFYYVEPPYNDPLAYMVLLVFELLNQAYFMGFFFLLSGYFTPGSFDRKGPARFLKDRLLRLGIPLIVFLFVLNPIASIGIWQMPAALTGITTPLTWQQYPHLIGAGPLWFVEMLLIFDFGYAASRLAAKRLAAKRPVLRPESDPTTPNYRAIGAFVLVLALASYLMRMVVPLGTTVLGFPTLAYLPQYLSFFALGVLSSRRNWLQAIPGSMGKVGFGAALGATVLLFPLALSGQAHFLGGGYWESAAYALWDSTFAVGMCLALTTFFRRYLNRQGRFGQFLTRHAYTVFITHAPVIVFLALALRGIHPEQLLKFGLAAIVGVPLCFAVAYLVRKIPLASRII
jgi:glucan biosynthesis protein C